jgi:hypothetical protein
MFRPGILGLLSAFLCVPLALRAEPADVRTLSFVRLAAPEVGPITYVTAEPNGRIWMLSERMDVLIAEGRSVRKLRDGTWAFEPWFDSSRQVIVATGIAAADGTLAVGGSYLSALGSSFASLFTMSLDGRTDGWVSMYDSKRSLWAKAEVGAHAKSHEYVEWSSGARTYVGCPGSDDVVLLESPSRVWIAKPGELTHFDGWAWSTEATELEIRGLWFDGLETLWALTDAGIMRSQEGVYTTIATPNGFAASALKGTGTNRVWFFGTNYLALWDGTAITEVACPMYQVADVRQSKDGNTYFVGTLTERGSTAVVLLPKTAFGGQP